MTTPQFDPASAAAAGPQPGAYDATSPLPTVPGPMPGMPGPLPGQMSGMPGAYEIAGPQRAAVVRKRGTQQMIIGAVLFVAGLLITFVTYSRASSSPTGGSYIVAFGPMIIGVAWFVRGAALVARSRRLGG